MGCRYSARVPDLSNSPDFHSLEEVHLSGPDIGSTRSRTSWIEFALVIKAAFPNTRLESADLLVFEHGQSYLPVSKAWLLALGVLHRVAIRQDHGLPLDADVDTSSPPMFPEPRLSGVSGYLDYTETDPYEADKTFISFEMHDLSGKQQDARRDHLSLRALCIFFKGYVEVGNGRLFNGRLHVQSISVAPGKSHARNAIAATKEKNLQIGLSIVQGVLVRARTEMYLSLQIRNVEEKLGDVVSGHEYHKVGRWPASRRDRRLDGAWDVWMPRKEVYRWGFVYLQVKPSPHGFVFDREDDFVISMFLVYKTVGKLLELAKTWLPSLGLAKEQQTLADLEAISEFDLINISWSRRLMRAIVSVDETIDEIMKNEGIMWKFVRTIHACDDRVRESVEKYLERIHAGEQEPKITLDLERGMMTIPQADGSQQDQPGVELDFEYTIAESGPHHSLRTAEIEPAHVVLACLQGQLRAVAWNMTLSPKGLLDLVQAERRSGRNDDIYYVSSNRFRSTQPRHSRSVESEASVTSSDFGSSGSPSPHHLSDTQSSRDRQSEVSHRGSRSISIEGLERGDEEN